MLDSGATDQLKWSWRSRSRSRSRWCNRTSDEWRR